MCSWIFLAQTKRLVSKKNYFEVAWFCLEKKEIGLSLCVREPDAMRELIL